MAVGAVGGALVVGCSTDRPAGDAALTASTLVDDAASPGSLTATTQGSDAGVPPEPTVSTDGATTTAAASSASSESGSGSGSTGAGADGGATPAPEWIGQRTLPTTPVGRVVPQTTPEELVGRRFVTVDLLAPPDDDTFVADIAAVDADTLARSTWEPGCPVEPEELSYLTMTFWGFDGKPHTGEMLVNAEVASDIVAVFERLFDARFPIEEMRIVTRADLDAPPTGDGNNTTAFVCRPVTGGTSFSEHAFGLAIDINPFHNPYQRNDIVLPELATYYLDRQLGQPGMVVSGDVVVEAFASIGWPWGGDWTSLKDYQHFSRSGR
ncbi:MAG: M15 family metallopeptidase [Actinomycetota bacterium]